MSEWHSTKDAVPASGPHLVTGWVTNPMKNTNERWYGIAEFYDGSWYEPFEGGSEFIDVTHFQSLKAPEHE